MKQAVYGSNMIKHTDGPCILCKCNTLGGIGSPFQQCGLMLSRVGRNLRAWFNRQPNSEVLIPCTWWWQRWRAVLLLACCSSHLWQFCEHWILFWKWQGWWRCGMYKEGIQHFNASSVLLCGEAVLFWSFILLLVAFLVIFHHFSGLWWIVDGQSAKKAYHPYHPWFVVLIAVALRQIMIAFLLNQVLSATYLLDEHHGGRFGRFSPLWRRHFGMIFPYWDVLVGFLEAAHHLPTTSNRLMIEVKNSHTSIDKSFKNPESRCPFRKPDFTGTESNRPAFGPPTVLWETTQLIGKKSLHTSAHAPELSSACSSTLDAKTDNLKTAKAGEFYAVKNLEACHESDESRLTLGNWPVIARHLCLHNGIPSGSLYA